MDFSDSSIYQTCEEIPLDLPYLTEFEGSSDLSSESDWVAEREMEQPVHCCYQDTNSHDYDIDTRAESIWILVEYYDNHKSYDNDEDILRIENTMTMRQTCISQMTIHLMRK